MNYILDISKDILMYSFWESLFLVIFTKVSLNNHCRAFTVIVLSFILAIIVNIVALFLPPVIFHITGLLVSSIFVSWVMAEKYLKVLKNLTIAFFISLSINILMYNLLSLFLGVNLNCSNYIFFWQYQIILYMFFVLFLYLFKKIRGDGFEVVVRNSKKKIGKLF